MLNPDGTCSIRYVGRENIENKLLVSLSEDDKVACVLTLDELTILIDAMSGIEKPTTKQKAMSHDLRNFRTAAFGV